MILKSKTVSVSIRFMKTINSIESQDQMSYSSVIATLKLKLTSSALILFTFVLS